MTLTTAAEWRAKRNKGIEVYLPEFEDTVFIKPMDPAVFLKTGRIPDFLAKPIEDLIARTGSASIEIMPKDLTPEQVKEWLRFLDELMKEVFASPRVVDNPREGENEIGVDDISYYTKLYVYMLFGRPAHVLRSFRPKQIPDVATVDVAKNNGTHAVETVGDTTVGQSPVGDA